MNWKWRTATACFMLATALFSAELKYFGRLGQSQREGSEPLTAVSCGSAVNDREGNVWFVNGRGVYLLEKGARDAKMLLPEVGKLMTDGREIFLQRNTVVYRLFRRPDGTAGKRTAFDFRRGFASTGIADAATKERFGKTLGFFALDGGEKKVYGWDPAGKSLGVILDLSSFPAKGKPVSVGFLPRSGFLLISTMYPDSRVYRFDTDGKSVTGGVWPAGGWMNAFSIVDGRAWGCGSKAVRYEDTLSEGRVVSVGDGRDNYARGIASDGADGCYLATTQGLKHYRMDCPAECDYRIGGIGTPAALALLNGRIIAVSGYSILSLQLDDLPDSPLGNTGDETWHVGGNWVSDAAAAVPDGSAFLILDRKLRKLWRFDPSKTKWGDRTRMTDCGRTFTKPADLAYAGDFLVVADNGALNLKNDLAEPVLRVDAFGRNEIVAAGADWVAFLKDGRTLWKRKMPVSDVAAIGGFIAAAGPDGLLLLTREGKQMQRLPYRLHTLAVSGKWLVGADHAGAVLRKFKLMEGK